MLRGARGRAVGEDGGEDGGGEGGEGCGGVGLAARVLAARSVGGEVVGGEGGEARVAGEGAVMNVAFVVTLGHASD